MAQGRSRVPAGIWVSLCELLEERDAELAELEATISAGLLEFSAELTATTKEEE
jgi:hypothetical protein